uniref:5'-nucleotidase C-terminal domain-containing protein n=1 Tax=Roseinatronobacter sp. TaxID=1945755 RepID=UPI0025F6E633
KSMSLSCPFVLDLLGRASQHDPVRHAAQRAKGNDTSSSLRFQCTTVVIRAKPQYGISMGAGTATLGDVLTVLPFQNTLYTLEVSGATLLAALEHGVNDVEEGAGRFPQVAGIRFKLDLSVPPNSGRVSDVEVMGAEGWAPLEPDETYGLVTNNFMAGGGDGYAMLRDSGMNGYDTAIDLAEVLARYLSESEPFAPVLDGRIDQ